MSITTITVKRDLWKKLTNLKVEENEKTLETMIEKMYETYTSKQEVGNGQGNDN